APDTPSPSGRAPHPPLRAALAYEQWRRPGRGGGRTCGSWPTRSSAAAATASTSCTASRPPTMRGWRRGCVDGKLECLYHGWQFDGQGKCVKIPQVPPSHTSF
uniref:Rieske domain-containing protein n=2 Tax=Aegilops tauschii subsp. strangulata TaxID=200361 RepID=A0A453EJ79_AEGTS